MWPSYALKPDMWQTLKPDMGLSFTSLKPDMWLSYALKPDMWQSFSEVLEAHLQEGLKHKFLRKKTCFITN